jgi:hypothetical protein
MASVSLHLQVAHRRLEEQQQVKRVQQQLQEAQAKVVKDRLQEVAAGSTSAAPLLRCAARRCASAVCRHAHY